MSGGSSEAEDELAERLTTTRRFPPQVSQETASLSDSETVRRWILAMRSPDDVQVHIRRHWGVLAVVADRSSPVSVIVSGGDHSWSLEREHLTIEQVADIAVDALVCEERPSGPEWQELT